MMRLSRATRPGFRRCSRMNVTGGISWPLPGISSRSKAASASGICCLERLGEVKPEKWQIEQADEPGDTIGAWFSFETAVGRGKGHLRLKDGRCWTFFTTLRELKGHEEKRGPTRIAGTTRGVVKGRRSWLDGRTDEKAELGISRQPYCLIIGGGQGGIMLAARLKQLGVPTLIVDALQRRATAGATATARSACTIPSGTITCRICRSRITGRSSRPRTRWATGWRSTPRSWSWTYWNATTCKRANLDDALKALDRRGRARRPDR